MDEIRNAIVAVFGFDRGPLDLDSLQVAARAVVVFAAGLVIMRLGSRRFLGKATPFDVMLGFLLGSLLSRAISGTAAFMPTIAGTLVIVLLHRVLATIVFHRHKLGLLVKGRPLVVIEDGAVRQDVAKRMRLTPGDIEEALHMHGVMSAAEVRLATLERNGVITVIQKPAVVRPVDEIRR
jgi:uncharacterized membrane protein YcaP (DUF421 family)